MMKTLSDRFTSHDERLQPEEARAYARESLIYNVTEDILVCMENRGVSRAEIARLTGRDPSYVSRVLNGEHNMTLATLSDLCHVLGLEPMFRLAGAEDDLRVVVDMQEDSEGYEQEQGGWRSLEQTTRPIRYKAMEGEPVDVTCIDEWKKQHRAA